MALQIRCAQPNDAPDIIRLMNALALEEGDRADTTEAYVAEYLAFPGSGILLAELDEQVVGLLAYSVRPNLYHAAGSGLIEELIIQQNVRGQGIGRVLVMDIIGRFKALGCAEVSVTTGHDNAHALHLYRSCGLDEEYVFLEHHF